jgi:hypothetical protein
MAGAPDSPHKAQVSPGVGTIAWLPRARRLVRRVNWPQIDTDFHRLWVDAEKVVAGSVLSLEAEALSGVAEWPYTQSMTDKPDEPASLIFVSDFI